MFQQLMAQALLPVLSVRDRTMVGNGHFAMPEDRSSQHRLAIRMPCATPVYPFVMHAQQSLNLKHPLKCASGDACKPQRGYHETPTTNYAVIRRAGRGSHQLLGGYTQKR
jgi:hypothetical protein